MNKTSLVAPSAVVFEGAPPPVAVFDLDGTLLDSAPGITAALIATGLARKTVTVDVVRALVSLGADRLVQDALGIGPAEVPHALHAFRGLYAAEPCTPDHLYPGAREALTTIRDRGVALAVCTNKPQHLAELVLNRLNLSALVPVIVGAYGTRPPKPDPAPLREAMTRSSPGGRAVLIGDSMVDAQTAKSMNVPFVFAAFGYGPFDRAFGCAYAIDALSELDKVLPHLLWSTEGTDASSAP